MLRAALNTLITTAYAQTAAGSIERTEIDALLKSIADYIDQEASAASAVPITVAYFPGGVDAVALTNITLSGLPTIDGQTLAAGKIVLPAGQTNAASRRPHVVASGAWTPVATALSNGMFVRVAKGTVYGGHDFQVSFTGTYVGGTTALTWTHIGGGGAVGSGLSTYALQSTGTVNITNGSDTFPLQLGSVLALKSEIPTVPAALILASEAEARAGANNVAYLSALRAAQLVDARESVVCLNSEALSIATPLVHLYLSAGVIYARKSLTPTYPANGYVKEAFSIGVQSRVFLLGRFAAPEAVVFGTPFYASDTVAGGLVSVVPPAGAPSIAAAISATELLFFNQGTGPTRATEADVLAGSDNSRFITSFLLDKYKSPVTGLHAQNWPALTTAAVASAKASNTPLTVQPLGDVVIQVGSNLFPCGNKETNAFWFSSDGGNNATTLAGALTFLYYNYNLHPDLVFLQSASAVPGSEATGDVLSVIYARSLSSTPPPLSVSGYYDDPNVAFPVNKTANAPRAGIIKRHSTKPILAISTGVNAWGGVQIEDLNVLLDMVP